MRPCDSARGSEFAFCSCRLEFVSGRLEFVMKRYLFASFGLETLLACKALAKTTLLHTKTMEPRHLLDRAERPTNCRKSHATAGLPVERRHTVTHTVLSIILFHFHAAARCKRKENSRLNLFSKIERGAAYSKDHVDGGIGVGHETTGSIQAMVSVFGFVEISEFQPHDNASLEDLQFQPKFGGCLPATVGIPAAPNRICILDKNRMCVQERFLECFPNP